MAQISQICDVRWAMVKALDPRPDSLDELAARLTLLRKAFSIAQGREREMTESDFARFCGVGIQALNNFTGARTRIGLDSAMRIRARTGVTLDFIYFDNRNGLPYAIAQAIEQIEAAERRRLKRA